LCLSGFVILLYYGIKGKKFRRSISRYMMKE
jgi:hypothetical protein